MKSGGAEIRVLETPVIDKKAVIDLGWGVVTCEITERSPHSEMTTETIYYMLSSARNRVMRGE